MKMKVTELHTIQHRISEWLIKWIQKLRGRTGSYSLPQCKSIQYYNTNRQSMNVNLYNDEINAYDSFRRSI
jgi:hypothetical protein